MVTSLKKTNDGFMVKPPASQPYTIYWTIREHSYFFQNIYNQHIFFMFERWYFPSNWLYEITKTGCCKSVLFIFLVSRSIGRLIGCVDFFLACLQISSLLDLAYLLARLIDRLSDRPTNWFGSLMFSASMCHTDMCENIMFVNVHWQIYVFFSFSIRMN